VNAHKVVHDKVPEIPDDWEPPVTVARPPRSATPAALGAPVFYGLDAFLERYGLHLRTEHLVMDYETTERQAMERLRNLLTPSVNSGKVNDMTYALTSDQVDLIAYAVRQVFLFDGLDGCPQDERENVRQTLVALGYDDPADEEADADEAGFPA
jgi:hypothetical protein